MISEHAISEAPISSTASTPTPPPPLTSFPERRPVMIYGQAAYRADMGSDFAGVPIMAKLERIDLIVSGINRDGSPRMDPSTVKLLKEIWPIIRGTVGQVINIYAGAKANTTEDNIQWLGPYPFVVGQSASVQPLVEGVYLAVRYESVSGADWSLLGHILDIEETGEPFR